MKQCKGMLLRCLEIFMNRRVRQYCDPCRELWYRASLAWRQILEADNTRSALVVAHNAVNQAMLNTAIGLPPTFFRRLTQTNGATSVVDFQPNGDSPPSRIIDRINQACIHASFVTLEANFISFFHFHIKACLAAKKATAIITGSLLHRGLPQQMVATRLR